MSYNNSDSSFIIIPIRKQMNDLITRLNQIRQVMDTLYTIDVIFTKELFDKACDWAYREEQMREEYNFSANDFIIDIEDLPNTHLKLFKSDSYPILIAWGLNKINLQYFPSIYHLCDDIPEIDNNNMEPQFDYFSDHEILVIQKYYQNTLNHLTRSLRDINTYMKYIENDSVWLDVLQNPIQIWTEAFLNQYLSEEKVQLILSSLDKIKQISNPLPYEPATLNYFSSNTSNNIKVEMPNILELVRHPPSRSLGT